jgi:hypothetical protein
MTIKRVGRLKRSKGFFLFSFALASVLSFVSLAMPQSASATEPNCDYYRSKTASWFAQGWWFDSSRPAATASGCGVKVVPSTFEYPIYPYHTYSPMRTDGCHNFRVHVYTATGYGNYVTGPKLVCRPNAQKWVELAPLKAGTRYRIETMTQGLSFQVFD